MRFYLKTFFYIVLILVTCTTATENTQRSDRTAEEHIALARAAAYRHGYDLISVFETLCRNAMSEEGPQEQYRSVAGLTGRVADIAPSLAERRLPPRSAWYAKPGKVFDNLYYIGSNNDSIWAITTSEGIIIIDTVYPYNSEELIIRGLERLGLDPEEIRYVIISHAHGDHIGGAQMLQERYGAEVVMGGATGTSSKPIRTATRRWHRDAISLRLMV